MKRILLILGLYFFSLSAWAHFGIAIPNHATIQNQSEAQVVLEVAFSHPMLRQGMDMQKPKEAFVFYEDQKENLKDTLKEARLFGKKAWQLSYHVKRPALYQFAIEPEPYYEKAEDSYIVHYTKAIVPAFGEEEGWDTPIGLKTEIVPLTRPFASYAGQVFQGKVLLDQKAVPGCTVEVEYYNQEGKYEAPNEYYVTQVLKTDENGIFTFSAPWAGWWGFAALNTSSETKEYKGEMKKVELGAILWIQFDQPKFKK